MSQVTGLLCGPSVPGSAKGISGASASNAEGQLKAPGRGVPSSST